MYSRHVLIVVSLVSLVAAVGSNTCPGRFTLAGTGSTVSLVSSGGGGPAPPGLVLQEGKLLPQLDSRTYFASSCISGVYRNVDYLGLNLLGSTLRYTVDLSGAGCGCNVALSLASMQQNLEPSSCGDYFCDANALCGVTCAEIDIQEANRYAWRSTLHSQSDRAGVGAGFGGGWGWNGPRDWHKWQYEPGSSCINTSEAFQVSASFPTDAEGNLARMEVILSQQGKTCELSTKGLNSYNGMLELSEAIKAGITPVISYWRSSGMLWMDGKGRDQWGPCSRDSHQSCENTISFSDFAMTPYFPSGDPVPAPGPAPVPVPVPMPPGSEDENPKIAVYKALGHMCGGEAAAVVMSLRGYASSSLAWLRTNQYQGSISFAAFAAGLLAVYNGPAFYKLIFLFLVGMVSVCVATYEMDALGVEMAGFFKFLVLCQVFFVVPLAAFNGFEGSQVLFGAILGVATAYGCGDTLRARAVGLECLWYSLGALVGFLSCTAWRQMLLHVLGPLFGGFLVVSGLGNCLSHIVGALAGAGLPMLPSREADWALAASQLLGSAAGNGSVAGGYVSALLALVIKGYGSERQDSQDFKMVLAMACPIVYIFVMAVCAVISRGPEVSLWWPPFGCLVWALVVLASIRPQLESIEDEEIRDNFRRTSNEVFNEVGDSVKRFWEMRRKTMEEMED